MIKVSGTKGAGGARGPRGASSLRPPSAGGFKIDDASAPSSPAAGGGVGETASASALGALIALQSDARSGAKNRAMAERALMLLERIRDGLVAGRIAHGDLAALADAADARLDEPDERLAAIYEEIALRAKVELAKLGR